MSGVLLGKPISKKKARDRQYGQNVDQGDLGFSLRSDQIIVEKSLEEVCPEKLKLPASLIASRFPTELHNILELASTLRHFKHLFDRTLKTETLYALEKAA